MVGKKRVMFSSRAATTGAAYHTCENCGSGQLIKQRYRIFEAEDQARTRGLEKCRRCLMLEAIPDCAKLKTT